MPTFPFDDELTALAADGLLRRRQTVESPTGARVVVDGREFLSFCSNDYLGLANHPALVAALQQGAAQFGAGAGASHLVSGHTAAHQQLEEALAAFTGLPRTLLFSSGYTANLGIVTALTGRDDEIFADKLNHASLNDAALLSRAKLTRFPHLDLAALERHLAASKARRKLVAVDAVFSMDGDIPPLPQLLALCERFDAWLLLDDAHGFGVLGEMGRGTLEHFGVTSPRIIYMATLGKAAGVAGAFAAGENTLIEWLIQRARTYIYTTALPAALAHAVSASLRLIAAEGWRRARLIELAATLRQRLDARHWRLLPSDTAIQPLLIGGNAETLAASAALRERGIWVPAIRPPTVPKGQARLRISLSAAHESADVEQLAAALNGIAP
jgi:8-amino-7-oxononanoate synthase